MPEGTDNSGHPTSRGLIRDIHSIEDLPKALFDSFLEGLTAAPQDFAIMTMGFIVGYEGIDLLGQIMKPFNDMMQNVVKGISGSVTDLTKLLPIGTFDMANMPVQMGGLVQDLTKLVANGLDDTGDLTKLLTLFPNKHITPAIRMPGDLGPGVSYYGPPPSGYTGDWPPYGTTLSKLETEKMEADKAELWKWELEQILTEQKLKIITGCVAAISAYAITRPGVAQSIMGAIGSMIQGALVGAGEAVPL